MRFQELMRLQTFSFVFYTKNEVKRQQLSIPDLMRDLCSLTINLQNAVEVRLPNPQVV